MLTAKQFEIIKKTAASKKMGVESLLTFIEAKYVNVNDGTEGVNTRDPKTFVFKMKTKKGDDETREREKKLGFKVRTMAESQKGDDASKQFKPKK